MRGSHSLHRFSVVRSAYMEDYVLRSCRHLYFTTQYEATHLAKDDSSHAAIMFGAARHRLANRQLVQRCMCSESERYVN